MNRTFAAIILVTASLVGACTDDADTPAAIDTPADALTGTGQSGASGPDQSDECPGLAESFDAWGEAGFSGTVTTSAGGRVECSVGYGIADGETLNGADTVFSIGSITKAFTAAAVFALIDDGTLALGDRAGDVLVDLTGPVAEVTIEQLTTHTSGLTGNHGSDHQPLGRGEALTAIGGLDLAFDPGSDFLYSNAGYTLLALMIEETAGMSYRDFMASRILPLPGGGIAGGFWDGEPGASGPRAIGVLDDGTPGAAGDFAGPHWALDGNGGLAMTTRDLASWTHALFTGQVVSPASVERISTPGFDFGDGMSETPGWVALDASVFGEPGLAAAGGGDDTGHNAVVVWLPNSERVVAMASNTGAVTAEELLQTVGTALVAGDPLPTPRNDEEAVEPGTLFALAGSYELDTGGTLEVTAEDGRLVIAATGPDAVTALFPLPDDVDAGDVAAHEADVLALLNGETDEGRDEREALESDIGPLDDIELVGSVVADGELRTYVRITSGTDAVLVWYALDGEGSIAGVEITDGPPARPFVSVADGFRPDDPSRAPEMTVTFDDDAMTVAGPHGTIVARSVS